MNDRTRPPPVILVHGLWFGAWSLRLLARRLRQAGFEPRRFHYRTTRADLDGHARDLRQFVGAVDSPVLHFVAHSLGGLVTLRMLAEQNGLPEGRVVLLGSPLGGSLAARKAAALPGAARLFGEVRAALESGFDRLAPGRETGMIAGSRSIGLGLLVGGIGGSGDGTVAVDETRAVDLREHRVMPVTHTGMLFSKDVAREVEQFLLTGSFKRSP
jgi:pimeloyl-ACP methyl ester carboxylesterase